MIIGTPPVSSGEKLDIDTNIFAGWIIEHYKDKNVKYFISYDKDYVILPIRKFADYFDVIAKYRIKKSGSGHPAKKVYDQLKSIISEMHPSATYSTDGKKFFVSIEGTPKQERFVLGKYTYFFSKQPQKGLYAITSLSNTYNMNVIFSIQLKKKQDSSDLAEFESDL